MNNNLQQYSGNGRGTPDVGRILMIAAAVYAIAPDIVPGPIDDMGVIVMALVVVGLMSLFGGAK
jgi:hypothetical protein